MTEAGLLQMFGALVEDPATSRQGRTKLEAELRLSVLQDKVEVRSVQLDVHYVDPTEITRPRIEALMHSSPRRYRLADWTTLHRPTAVGKDPSLSFPFRETFENLLKVYCNEVHRCATLIEVVHDQYDTVLDGGRVYRERSFQCPSGSRSPSLGRRPGRSNSRTCGAGR